MLDLFSSNRVLITTLAGPLHFGEAKDWTIEEERPSGRKGVCIP